MIKRFGTKLSPRAAAAVSPWKGGTVKVVYSEAFRSPTAYETPTPTASPRCPRRISNRKRCDSVESSFEQRFGAHRVLLGVFRSWWEDMVLLEQLSAEQVAAAIAAGQLSPDASAVVQYQNVSSINTTASTAPSMDRSWGATSVRIEHHRRLRPGARNPTAPPSL